MSRIAKNSIKLPQDTTCSFDNNILLVQGKLGEATLSISELFTIKQKDNEKLLNPVWHIHKGNPPKEKIVMPFSMLLNIVGSSNAKTKDVLWKFVQKFHNELNPKNNKILDELTNYAINYFKDEVEPKKKYKKPNDDEKKALKNLISALKKISQDTPAEEIQTKIYFLSLSIFIFT